MYDLIPGVPVRSVLRSLMAPRRSKYPFRDMAVGEMFFIPNRDVNNMSSRASTLGRLLKRRFTTRLVYMKLNRKKAWEPCQPDDYGAVLGIGVWRTK